MDTPIFTGRIGEEHDAVVRDGSDFLIVEFSDGRCETFFKALPPFQNLLKWKDVDRLFPERACAGYLVIRAYNAEDAVNHSGAARMQHRAHCDGLSRWLEAPFLDEAGNLVVNEQGQLIGVSFGEYAAYWPCKAAASDVQHSEFAAASGFFETAPGWTEAILAEDALTKVA